MKALLSSILVVSVLIVFLYSQGKLNIAGTKWLYKWNTDYSEYPYDHKIFHRDSTLESYSYEDGITHYGYYKVIGDTVIAVYDSANWRKASKGVVKYICRGDTLRPIYAQWDRLKPKTKFREDYYFLRDTTYREKRNKKQKGR